jgi:hypothetical protein
MIIGFGIGNTICGCFGTINILNAELNLFQILLEDENFDGALNLLDQACSEGLELDVLLFNTILQKACVRVLYLMCPFIPSHLSSF